ncbi:hypothetical protein P4V54_09130 [Brevibacillus nitrificans]|uniref:hypothetical protein n=1 Tax=Brevibacillus nitrificans TaxID=651560 RepID=UPI002E206A4E|nr:hypothetical protein [Brevibacillus nitrificans]
MEIQLGKHYQNSQGLVRLVKGFEEKSNRWNKWTEVIYVPISQAGQEGKEKRCALSTMKGWAKREFDPTAIHWKSPKREEASRLLEQLTDTQSAVPTRQFVDLCVEAAKDELRRELGLDLSK